MTRRPVSRCRVHHVPLVENLCGVLRCVRCEHEAADVSSPALRQPAVAYVLAEIESRELQTID